jgi:hypothetical protein
MTGFAPGQGKADLAIPVAQILTSLPQKAAGRGFLAKRRRKWHDLFMCFHATMSGAILPVWSKTAYDEVMLRCARIGFKP